MASNNFVLRRTLTGLGLFTLEAIPAGKRLIEYTGSLITAEEALKSRSKYLFEVDEKCAIDGSSRSNIARYINHSCQPNAKAFVTGRRIWIWSKKRIDADGEITLHYGKDYFDEFIKANGCCCRKCLT